MELLHHTFQCHCRKHQFIIWKVQDCKYTSPENEIENIKAIILIFFLDFFCIDILLVSIQVLAQTTHSATVFHKLYCHCLVSQSACKYTCPEYHQNSSKNQMINFNLFLDFFCIATLLVSILVLVQTTPYAERNWPIFAEDNISEINYSQKTVSRVLPFEKNQINSIQKYSTRLLFQLLFYSSREGTKSDEWRNFWFLSIRTWEKNIPVV